jgi:predicted CXXCH cytochrome family protein
MLSRTILPVFLAGLVVALGGAASEATAAAAERSCLDCHKKLLSKRTIHPAIAQYARMEQGCPSCHEAPHGKNKATKSLTAAVPDLCFQCHDKEHFIRKTVHPPVAAGDCMSCHDPHASDNALLLVEPVPYLCRTCHQDKNDGKHILGGYGLGDIHPIQGRKDPSRRNQELTCTSCHNPHSSSQPRLFTNETATTANLCLLCHVRVTVRP